MWGFSSSLSNVVNIILGKLEGKPFTQNVTNTNSQNVNNIVQQMASSQIFTVYFYLFEIFYLELWAKY